MKFSYSIFACALLASGWADLARTQDVGAGGGSIGVSLPPTTPSDPSCTGSNEWFSPYRSTFEAHERGENLDQLKQPGSIDDSEYLLNPDFSINNCQTTRYYYLDIHETRAAPDGLEREMFLFNGRINGPLIEANQGDTIVVYVHNYLDVGTTVHWHGLAQNGTGWADGPLGVTQCPIPPGTTFVYKYTLSRPDQCGTYWYHAHRLAHYGDGLVAPLIIHCPGDPLKRGDLYDIDQVVVIRDHYHPLSTRIVNSLLVNGSFQGSALTPSPNSGLINGRGRYDCSFAPEGSVCTDNATLTEFKFPKGSRVRLRLINSAAHAQFLVSVDEHPLNVVEADDTPVWQTTVHRAPINIGQRYSSIINTADNNDGDSFWMRADINTACFGANFTDLNPEVKAIIRIGSASSSSSPSSENGSNPPSQGSPGDSSDFSGDQSGGDNPSGSQRSSNNNGTGDDDTPNGGGDGSTDKSRNSTGDGPNGFGGHDTGNSGDVPDGSDRSDNSDDSDASGDGGNGSDDQDNSAGSDDSGDQQGSQGDSPFKKAARLSKRNDNNNNSESNTDTNQNLPTSTDWSDAVNGSCHDLAESTLVPRVPFNPPGANISHEFRATILTTPSGATGFAANNVSFESFVDDPFLFRVNRGDDIPAGLSASIVLDDKSLAHDIIINNVNPVDHPFHLHGVQMHLIARGNGTVDADSISSVAVNLNNPIRRDTISVTGNTYVIVRVIPDNPGVWAFHCHILYHQLLGLMGVVVIRPDLIRKMEIPQHARDVSMPDQSNRSIRSLTPRCVHPLQLCTRGSSLNDANNQNPQANIEPGRRIRRSINPLLPSKDFVRKRLSLNQD
ncbi:BZ3500_MvSof-1268-A1-R1_Chr3-1g06069 [Microbotryum saponariae]|uniref:BZ3500_MvSof-1268-A1-R1_Chr3-1g06069 protein n=1 Tax=Microbotryum saponariae TaxID=289078 RepID=A0A2X0L3R8_9BASI|nr:BZ3500_MvSof-1268-A1-R1_Chr3-1g06069 [Microbotryum saponariae]SDA03903.1 BZ3501_MvSof-1269-A2-R1_Chr3-2g05754 [Microbotryum saponariae]